MFGSNKAPSEPAKDKTSAAASSQSNTAPPVFSAGQHTTQQASSVFEFGPVVSEAIRASCMVLIISSLHDQVKLGDEMMRGVCIGEDPHAIEACTWVIEPIKASKDNHHRYRVEF